MDMQHADVRHTNFLKVPIISVRVQNKVQSIFMLVEKVRG